MRRTRTVGLAAVFTCACASACGGPLSHVATDPRLLDPFTGRASAPVPVRTGAEPVRIAVYGDVLGERDKHRAVVEAIRAARPDLVVFTGDALRCYPVAHMPDFGLATYFLPFWPQVQRGYPWVTLASLVPFPALIHETIGRVIVPPRDPDGFNAFLTDTAPLRLEDRVPFVFVPGNHDEYHHADRREVARLFVSNENGETDPDLLFFSVEIGGYRVHALDTGTDLFGDGDPIGAGSRQLAWLEASLADAQKKGLGSIVAMHLPPYSSGAEDEPSPQLRAHVAEGVLDKHEVALVLAGHSHAYERIEHPGYRGKPVTHVVTGGGGAPFHHEAAPAGRDPGSKAFVQATTHFVLLELAPGEIRGRMVPVVGAGKPDEFVARR
jgi:3',5'-cyclic AMP phosphodiesterase CpdA